MVPTWRIDRSEDDMAWKGSELRRALQLLSRWRLAVADLADDDPLVRGRRVARRLLEGDTVQRFDLDNLAAYLAAMDEHYTAQRDGELGRTEIAGRRPLYEAAVQALADAALVRALLDDRNDEEDQ